MDIAQITEHAVKNYGMKPEVTVKLVRSLFKEGKTEREIAEILREMYRCHIEEENERILKENSMSKSAMAKILEISGKTDAKIAGIRCIRYPKAVPVEEKTLNFYSDSMDSIHDIEDAIRSNIDILKEIEDESEKAKISRDIVEGYRYLSGAMEIIVSYAETYKLLLSPDIEKELNDVIDFLDELKDNYLEV